MKKALGILCVILALSSFFGCSSDKNGKLKFEVKGSMQGFEPEKMMDGDINTGWVSDHSIQADSAESVKIDLGKVQSISEISIDDSFKDGYTNKKDPYEQLSPVVEDWDCSGWFENNTPDRSLDSQVDGKGWDADAVPGEQEPCFMLLKLKEPVKIDKIEINNDQFGTVPKKFEVLYSTDGANFEKLFDVSDHSETSFSKELEKTVELKEIKYVVYDQSGEKATLDEIYLFSKSADKETPHYPRKFSILVSKDDKTYNVAATEIANSESKATFKFDKQDVRYIKYLIMDEYEGNKPSMGEITVK